MTAAMADGQPMTATYGTTTRPSWREEARQDRSQRSAARIAEKDAAEERRAKRAKSRCEARAEAANTRAERLAQVGEWVNDHTTDLLFVPVIGVPAALAWTAMASYGAHLYGTPGRALPAFSEGAMWAFAAAVTVTRHRHPERPVWPLQLGIVVFALFGAVLNFAHGLTLAHVGSPVTGAVMALLSVAGVTAHQLTKAGPLRRTRKTRAERDTASIARAIAKRETDARRQAIKAATAEVDEHGNAWLVFIPTAANHGELTPPEADTIRAEVADKLSDAIDAMNAALTSTAETLRAAIDGTRDTLREEIATAIRIHGEKSPRLPQPATADRIARLQAKHPDLTPQEIADRLGISARTVRRYTAATPQDTPNAA